MTDAFSSVPPEELLAHGDFVRALARSLLEESAADDVVQQTWLQALTHAPREVGSLRSWLARVVRNFVHSAKRNDARRTAREHRAADRELVPSTEDVFEREAIRRRVVEAVVALREPYRATILLRYYESLPPREIARRLGIPLNTVRTRIQRGLQHMRTDLDAERRDWGVILAPLAASKVNGFALLSGTIVMTTGGKLSMGALLVVLVASVWWWQSSAAHSVPRGIAAIPIAAKQDETTTGRTADPGRAVVDSPIPSAESKQRIIRGSVVDHEGGPIANARVSLRQAERPSWGNLARNRGLDTSRLAPITTATNAQGVFAMRDVPLASGLALQVDHPDYLPLVRDRIVISEDGVELGVLRLERGALISGTVSAPDGVPFAGATVSVRTDVKTPREDLMAPPLGNRTCETDASGRFRLSVPNGTGRVVAEATGYTRAVSEKFLLRVGFDVGVALTLGQSASLCGVVLNHQQEPIQSATVTVTEEASATASLRKQSIAVLTDAAGRFEIAGLDKALTYELSADAKGLGRRFLVGVTAVNQLRIVLEGAGAIRGHVIDKVTRQPIVDFALEMSGAGTLAQFPRKVAAVNEANPGTGEFEIAGVDPGYHDVFVRSGGYVAGVVPAVQVYSGQTSVTIDVALSRVASLAGTVVDAIGDLPLAAATLKIDQHAVTADEAGRFAAVELRAGRVLIDAHHPDFAPKREEVFLSEGEQRAGVVIRLGRGGTVRGFSRDADGSPRPGDIIRLQTFRPTADGRQCEAVDLTDADGGFRMEHVTPGDDFVVSCQIPAAGTPFVSPPDLDWGKQHVTVREGEVTSVEFSTGVVASLQGEVTTSQGPVAGVRVDLRPATRGVLVAPLYDTITDADGRYQFAIVAAGSYALHALHPDAAVHQVEVIQVCEARAMTKDIRLYQGRIRGTVHRDDGSPIEGAVVSLENTGQNSPVEEVLFGSQPNPVTTTATGWFDLPWLAPGQYRITVSHATSFIVKTDVSVPADGIAAEQSIVVVPAASVRVTLRSHEYGTPLRSRAVELKAATGGAVVQAMTDRNGVARFDALESGDYLVTSPGLSPAQVHATAGATSETLLPP